MNAKIPKNSVIGINYSGMHDTSIAIVSPNGTPIYAMSLERISRLKQDGRPPDLLLKDINWKNIQAIATTTHRNLKALSSPQSRLHPISLQRPCENYLRHKKEFGDYLDKLKKPIFYCCHEHSHAHSAFWASDFEECICFVYDGGMANCQWFGGLFTCDRKKGVRSLDLFDSQNNAKISSLYSVVTAVLGFTPNKHEGKITGLAAFGSPSKKAHKILSNWLVRDYLDIEQTIKWEFEYSKTIPPTLFVDQQKIANLRKEIRLIPASDVAATLQKMTEDHVLEILINAKKNGIISKRICLAGGLFANVKLNQKILGFGFEEIFIAPPMTDEGTALGAAWAFLAHRNKKIKRLKNISMYLGNKYNKTTAKKLLSKYKIKYKTVKNPARLMAIYLKKQKIAAIHQGACEFGPRALGNRSILAAPNDVRMNEKLNKKLKRTEFMPFAPVVRLQDANDCFYNALKIKKAGLFMTITDTCKSIFAQKCPAVVHLDQTARPQFVTKKSNKLIYDILTEYKSISKLPALINTSLNIHEEPITCSIEDSLKTFFWSGIDVLLLEGRYVVESKKNCSQGLEILQNTNENNNQYKIYLNETIQIKNSLFNESHKNTLLKEQQIQHRENDLKKLVSITKEKENVIQEKEKTLLSALLESEKKEEVIQKLLLEIKAWAICGIILWPVQKLLSKCLKIKKKITAVRLGKLRQHSPENICFLVKKKNKYINDPCLISVVTPSFNQGEFLERTVLSVVVQNYQKLEYVVQDGGSSDNSLKIIKKHAKKLHKWDSRPDQGQAHAINMGFQKTTGEIMAWINADDTYTPGALWEVARFFSENPCVDVIYGYRLIIDEHDKKIGTWIMPPHDNEILSWADYIPQETLFWRRTIWEKVGGQLDESLYFALDWDLLQRFREAGASMVRIPTFLGCFRVHSAQKTSRELGLRGKKEMDYLREKVHGRIPTDAEIWGRTKKYLRQSIYSNLKWEIAHGLKRITLGKRRNVFIP